MRIGPVALASLTSKPARYVPSLSDPGPPKDQKLGKRAGPGGGGVLPARPAKMVGVMYG